jgi:hypothetical protein
MEKGSRMKVKAESVKIRTTPVTKSIEAPKVRGRESKSVITREVVPATLGKLERAERVRHQQSVHKSKHQRASRKE